MGRARNQQGSLYKTTSKRSGLSSWWGRYRRYDNAGRSDEERTFLGYTHEHTENQARIKLVDFIRRVNQRSHQHPPHQYRNRSQPGVP